MRYPLSAIRTAIELVIRELYPDESHLIKEYSCIDDIVNQVLFELIKEDYKRNAETHSIQHYIDKFDIEASNRKYTRAIQYAQHYKNADYELIKREFGVNLPELKAEDISGKKVFEGHHYTEKDFWNYKIQAECKLLNKLHQKQIESSKNVSEIQFKNLFSNYRLLLDELEPVVDDYDEVICKTLLFYGLETRFLIDYIYSLCVAAEEKNYPDEIPTDRILSVCSISPVIPATSWCPEVFVADYCMLLKWDSMSRYIFGDDGKNWQKKLGIVYDCKQLKNIILQRKFEDWLKLVSDCTVQEKAEFIIENYWIWDKRIDYEWTPERIRYYRKLHYEITRTIEKPHIK